MGKFAERRERGPAAVFAVLAMAAALFGMAFTALTKPAFIDSYREEGTFLVVGYVPEEDCSSTLRAKAIESPDAVRLDIVSVGTPDIWAATGR